jgi:hypothetical protein
MTGFQKMNFILLSPLVKVQQAADMDISKTPHQGNQLGSLESPEDDDRNALSTSSMSTGRG